MFGVLNMLVSVASFVPIIVVGTISDWVGTTVVIVIVGVSVDDRRGRVGGDPQDGDRRRPRQRR